MAKTQSISKVVDEIHASILETAKKQRRIRSGTFWNKFGFERRTKERVEAVKAALKERSITFNLEDSLFGSEKRGELIVLNLSGSEYSNIVEKTNAKIQNVPPAKHKEIGESSFESVHKHDRIEAKIKHLAEVR